MLDIHSNQPVYLEKPELVLPERKSNRGPEPKRFTVVGESRKVSEYIQGLDWKEWDEIKVRKTAKGTLRASAQQYQAPQRYPGPNYAEINLT